MTFVFRCRTLTACRIEVFSIMWGLIVIHTVCTTKYLLHASLYIFHISRGIKHIGIRHLTANSIVAQTAVEVGSS